jgi:protein N-terminal methyltransferase
MEDKDRKGNDDSNSSTTSSLENSTIREDGESGEEEPFYSDAAKYWAKIEPTDNGMLGGLGHLSRLDVQNSEKLLKNLFKIPDAPGTSYALDCGSGIGRITKNLLQRFFSKVDLVDQDEKFIQQARKNFEGNEKIGEMTSCGLQKYQPEPEKYDVIWVQWVLSHMTDEDLIQFMHRCRSALRKNGVVIAKENCTRTNQLETDSVDSSVTRSFAMFVDIFKKADYNVISNVKQKNFPKELYPVWTFVLRPGSVSNPS